MIRVRVFQVGLFTGSKRVAAVSLVIQALGFPFRFFCTGSKTNRSLSCCIFHVIIYLVHTCGCAWPKVASTMQCWLAWLLQTKRVATPLTCSTILITMRQPLPPFNYRWHKDWPSLSWWRVTRKQEIASQTVGINNETSSRERRVASISSPKSSPSW